MSPAKNIPTVDLNDYTAGDGAARKRLIETLGHGLNEFGFLNVEGHGIDSSLIRGTYDLWKRFFELPDEVKRRYAGVEGEPAATRRSASSTPRTTRCPTSRSSGTSGRSRRRGTRPPRVPGQRLAGGAPGVPAAHPALYQPGRVAETCCARSPSLRDAALDLRLTIDADKYFRRVIHYPPLKPACSRAVRAAAHEDINLITLFCEATASGLEILTREGEWLPVDTAPGQIVVDSGDMLTRFTNEVIPATTHRVVNPAENATRDRYSMPFFVHPYSACDLTIPERFVDAENPPKYPPITAGQFLEQRLREIGLKK